MFIPSCKIFKILLVIAVTLLITNCFSKQQIALSPTVDALVEQGVLVKAKRSIQFGGSACSLEVKDNGNLVGVLNVGDTIEWTRYPGLMRIYIRDCWNVAFKPLEIMTEAGLFYELTVSYPWHFTFSGGVSSRMAAQLYKKEPLPENIRQQIFKQPALAYKTSENKQIKTERSEKNNVLKGKDISKAAPNLSVSVLFNEPSGDKTLVTGVQGEIKLTIQNFGEGDAFNVKGQLRTDRKVEGLSFDREVMLGIIHSGETVTVEIPVQAVKDLSYDTITFFIEIKEENGFDANPVKLTIEAKAFKFPKLVVSDIGINDQNNNSQIEPMEIVELIARIQNIGYGNAFGVSVDIRPGENIFIAGDAKTSFDLGNIQTGRFKDVTFMFYTNNRIKDGEEIPLFIQINEARPRFSTSQSLALTMHAPQKRVEEVVVKSTITDKNPDIVLAGGLSVDVDINVPEGEKAGKHDIAVIIGNKNYKSLSKVEYADRDAIIMKEYITRTFGYNHDNIIFFEDATLADFNDVFGIEKDYNGRLFQYVKPNISNVFVYYVGHGAPDFDSNEAYFVPVDANPRNIKANGYRLQTFYDNLSKIPVKKMTVVLDSCFSGNSEKGMLFKNISPAMVKVKREFQGPANATLITSAATDQVSTWYPDKKHSLFTYYFLKGIQGEADVNKDKIITTGELKAYLNEHVPYMARRLKGIEQQPIVMGSDSSVVVKLK